MDLEDKLIFGCGEGPAICLEIVEVTGRIRSLQRLLEVPIASEKSLHKTPIERLVSWEKDLESEVGREMPDKP